MNTIRKGIAASLMIIMLLSMSACSGGGKAAENADPETTEVTESADTAEAATQQADNNDGSEAPADTEEFTMKMTINGTEVNVVWENNESARALAEMAAKAPVTIKTSPYGGFEQVGSIGATLPSDDTDITTVPGDIMLYTSSNIVIFYGSNSWAYTRLGRITDKSDAELRELLGGSSVTVTITAE